MKLLTLIRHAKSDWNSDVLTDFERPLNDRGKRDAPMMGERMKNYCASPDLVLFSTAKRTDLTIHKIGNVLDWPEEVYQGRSELYDATYTDIISVIAACDDDVNHLVVCAHNPGITYTAEQMSGLNFSNVPTCGVIHLSFEFSKWKTILREPGELLIFDYPKKIKLPTS